MAMGNGELSALRERISGEALVPGDAGWDAGRQPWNLIADQEPAVVGVPESADDVAGLLEFARERGLRVAPQGTGHGSSTLAPLGDALLLRTTRLNDVELDADERRIRVGAGCLWRDVVPIAGEHGLAALHGSSGTVGVAGYTLSGGLGWLARKHGFSCNNVSAIEVVTAAGEPRRVAADSEPDLFWALRGGGGGVAIVTALELELVRLREAYAGSLMWPIELAADVTDGWREWTGRLPDELTSNLKLVRFPPLPDVPEPLRGRALAAVTFAYAGAEDEGRELTDELRAIADPYLDTAGVIPAPALADLAGDPPGPLAGRGAGVLLSELDADAAAAYVELAGPGVDVPLIHLELRHLGGALGRAEPDAGALAAAGGEYLLYGVGAVMTPDADAPVKETLERVLERMNPWTAESGLLGFAEQEPGLAAAFDSETGRRLAEVKASYDPDGLILGNHTD